MARDVRFCVSEIVIENVTAEVHGLDPQQFEPHSSAAELRHLANVRRDRPIWDVDLGGTVQGVMRHPWVASVEATRRWPDTVVIRVVEHRPVLLLQQGGLYYVNARAEVFKRARGSDLDYPVLTGLEPGLAQRNPEVARRILSDAIDLLEQVDRSGELLVDDLSEIRFHQQDGFSLVLRSGTELLLGFADASERLARLEKLRASGLDPRQPHRIDLAPATVALVSPPSKRTSPGLD
jgi:cell division protein FtsQ